MNNRAAVKRVWQEMQLSPEAMKHLHFTTEASSSRALSGSHQLTLAATSTIAAVAVAASEILRLRGGPCTDVIVDPVGAAAEFKSEAVSEVEGEGGPKELWDSLAGLYRTHGGGWVRLHTNFPDHRAAAVRAVFGEQRGTHPHKVTRTEMEDEILEKWGAEELQECVVQAGGVAASMRTLEMWNKHPQKNAAEELPLIEVCGITPDSPPVESMNEKAALPLWERTRMPVSRPLDGVRVVDMTRVLAGPVCTRALAAYGADVVRVTAPHLPSVADADMGVGKLSASIDLRQEAGRERLRRMISEADVFVQAYAPGTLERRGFGPRDVAAMRPGIVYVDLSAFSHAGPWSQMKGFDSIVQTACGFNSEEAIGLGREDGAPMPFPVQAIDHATGFLMAFAAMGCILKQLNGKANNQHPVSYLASLSLLRTALWIRSLGRLDSPIPPGEAILDDMNEIKERTEWLDSGFGGRLRVVKSAAILREQDSGLAIPMGYSHPSVPPSTDNFTAWPQ